LWDLLVRAKDLLERAKLLLWGPIASAIGAGSLRREMLSLVEHAPEQHPLRLAVAAGIPWLLLGAASTPCGPRPASSAPS
jgi:hypothetical protein